VGSKQANAVDVAPKDDLASWRRLLSGDGTRAAQPSNPEPADTNEPAVQLAVHEEPVQTAANLLPAFVSASDGLSRMLLIAIQAITRLISRTVGRKRDKLGRTESAMDPSSDWARANAPRTAADASSG